MTPDEQIVQELVQIRTDAKSHAYDTVLALKGSFCLWLLILGCMVVLVARVRRNGS